MWLGELITQRGIGQGMSILIFANVVATLPLDVDLIKATKGWAGLVIIGIVCVGLLVAIVFVELGQRRIPVTFAKRVQGRRMYGGQSTYIPLKVNQAGVIPIIFASSLLYIPVLIATVMPWKGVRNWIQANLYQPDGRRLPRPLRPVHRGLHLLLRAGELRPVPAGRHDPQAGRLHPRHPPRAADRAATSRRS